MSSETSTEPQPAFEPWQRFTLAGLIGATIAVFMARGESPAAVIMISITIFAAAGVGIAALRTFLPLTQKAATDGARILGGRTRTALEREKTLVLRSIKELEFDRAMGKVSEKDFAEMSGRLRARARWRSSPCISGDLAQKQEPGAWPGSLCREQRTLSPSCLNPRPRQRHAECRAGRGCGYGQLSGLA